MKHPFTFMKFIPATIWFIITLVLLTLPGSALPKSSMLDHLQVDKIIHIGLFSILALLIFLPFIKMEMAQGQKKTILIRVAIGCLVYGILMEFVQKYWIPNRSFDLLDIVADGIGSFLPILFFKRICKWGNKVSEEKVQ